jgi:hypothetical protein
MAILVMLQIDEGEVGKSQWGNRSSESLLLLEGAGERGMEECEDEGEALKRASRVVTGEEMAEKKKMSKNKNEEK